MNWLLRLRRPAALWALAGLTVLLAAALIPLSLAARQNPLATGGANVVIALSFARGRTGSRLAPAAQPDRVVHAPLAPGLIYQIDGGLYNVLNYRLSHRLPLAPVALVLFHFLYPGLAVDAAVILLFPDGRLPSPR